ncbi:hypothetical protein DFH06DRAFT_1152126 [Mycena polygramma]|nr:hypothetical protein DFH06DRAFT_1152126 [Mycena polygramma]
MTTRVAEHSKDLGAAESADSAGLIGIDGGIVGDGKCREHGGNPESKVCRKMNRTRKWNRKKDRMDRGTTIEEGENVEKREVMTEATGGGRSIGSGETRCEAGVGATPCTPPHGPSKRS